MKTEMFFLFTERENLSYSNEATLQASHMFEEAYSTYI